MTEQLKGPTSSLVPRARFLFVTQFWQKLSRVGSAARLLGSLSKGVFRWNWGNFVGASQRLLRISGNMFTFASAHSQEL